MRTLRRLMGGACLAIAAISLGWTALAAPQQRGAERLPPPREVRVVPTFEAVAETDLLMKALAHPNYRALAKHLQGKGPADEETWKFARGQALLIAETGNLLLIRPPRNDGREAWMSRATDLRQSASNLARRLGNRDLERARTALTDLTRKCNACHQKFRVKTRIDPNAELPSE